MPFQYYGPRVEPTSAPSKAAANNPARWTPPAQYLNNDNANPTDYDKTIRDYLKNKLKPNPYNKNLYINTADTGIAGVYSAQLDDYVNEFKLQGLTINPTKAQVPAVGTNKAAPSALSVSPLQYYKTLESNATRLLPQPGKPYNVNTPFNTAMQGASDQLNNWITNPLPPGSIGDVKPRINAPRPNATSGPTGVLPGGQNNPSNQSQPGSQPVMLSNSYLYNKNGAPDRTKPLAPLGSGITETSGGVQTSTEESWKKAGENGPLGDQGRQLIYKPGGYTEAEIPLASNTIEGTRVTGQGWFDNWGNKQIAGYYKLANGNYMPIGAYPNEDTRGWWAPNGEKESDGSPRWEWTGGMRGVANPVQGREYGAPVYGGGKRRYSNNYSSGSENANRWYYGMITQRGH